jgi:tetratricopeptide (TPR) repeat protein
MKRLSVIILMLLILAFPSSVRADMAPPYNPPGVNPEPGRESTQVRMAAETVLIEVRNEGELSAAHVTADFSMHNTGNEPENLAVRFPIAASDGRSEYPEIKNLTIKVDGKKATHRRVIYPDISYQPEDIPWAEFDVTFPPGEDVALQAAYDLEGTGYYPETAFYYILRTGAGWKDTIGSADIILRLPYAADPQNVIMGIQIGWAETTPGGIFQGNEVRWHFEDFEPGADGTVQDMEFALVSPKIWTMLFKEKENVTQNPRDGEAWGRLGKYYKEIFFESKGYRMDEGGEQLYQASIQAYEKCLSLKPEDAQWHAGFADLLASRVYWDAWGGNYGPDAFRALEEIRTALHLAPEDSVVQEIAQNISYWLPGGLVESGDGYDFPWLTATPTAKATIILPPTTTPVAAVKTTLSEPSETPQSAPVSPSEAPKPTSTLCGSTLLIPLVMLFWLRKR